MRIGILTSGGDCPGLNAVIRGFGKYAFENIKNVELIGIADGYGGLIRGECREMRKSDFTGILTLGGTILGTSRQPFKLMTVEDENSVSRLDLMKRNYKKMGLDCLLTLGGAGTHKTAALLSAEGCNVIGLPKTIDNDIWGTDVSSGSTPPWTLRPSVSTAYTRRRRVTGAPCSWRLWATRRAGSRCTRGLRAART